MATAAERKTTKAPRRKAESGVAPTRKAASTKRVRAAGPKRRTAAEGPKALPARFEDVRETHPERVSVKDGSTLRIPKVEITRKDDLSVKPKALQPGRRKPTPESEWRPEWKPRKRRPGTVGLVQVDRRQRAYLMQEAGALPELNVQLPWDEEADAAVWCPELLDAFFGYLSDGGTVMAFSLLVNRDRRRLNEYVKALGREAEYAAAKQAGADAMVEQALAVASTPVDVESVTEKYDESGKLVSKIVERGDNVPARKLAYLARMEIAGKIAPDRYGNKVEIKDSTSGAAAAILEARRRAAQDVVDVEAVEKTSD